MIQPSWPDLQGEEILVISCVNKSHQLQPSKTELSP